METENKFYKESFFPWKKRKEKARGEAAALDCQDPEVCIQLPAQIEIGLVQANELKPYELFILLFSLTFTTAVGFFVSWVTLPQGDPGAPALLFSSVAFGVFTIIFGVLAYNKRAKLYGGVVVRKISLKIFGSVPNNAADAPEAPPERNEEKDKLPQAEAEA